MAIGSRPLSPWEPLRGGHPRSGSVRARVRAALLAPAHRLLAPAALYLALAAGSLLFVLPIVWMISTSLKPLEQLNRWPPEWIPSPIVWSSYPEALTFLPFGRYFANSVFVAGSAIVGTLLSCTLVAYGFARIRFPGRDLLFMILISTIM